MTAKDKDEVLAVVNGFLESFSGTKPPFPDTLKYLVPGALAVLSRPDGLVQCTLAGLVDRLEELISKIHQSGGASVSEVLAHPGPDIWVHDRLAAVWSGFSVNVDGRTKSSGVCAFTLVKLDDGWKIAAIADTHFRDDEAPPVLVEEASPELVGPILESMRLLNEKKWDEMMRPRLAGGGATIARSPRSLTTMLWPELDEKMRSMSERAPGYVEHKVVGSEGRMMGDLGFVWSQFTVTLNGELRITGYTADTLLKRDGKWLLSGEVDG
ncbi:hypothetical protein BKA67DRAFT_665192 [Truncatella angustata]|uniref:SnoaL-like domain-containing protein n=1 Tax=Truncatella angustata TaxID=152316 RepID=A0A9P8U836_9PEZI|nr:uncharacterized protein BKA67DRAFT_665192 [Truncatella angustata]KAH6643378.1 hypothetical protein BKA67DRAFT_665192 [Truncatella angustata]